MVFSKEYKKGFQRALMESYAVLGNILNEGMDIRAFEKFSDDKSFQRACQNFKSKIQGDNDAKLKYGLGNLNDFKENPEGFIKAVEDALEYIEKRKNGKSIRKAQRKKGVNILYEDEKCIITMPDGPKYARAAGSLLNGKDSCPWCVANAYPFNKEYWRKYNIDTLLFIYDKDNGEPVDAWCMVFKNLNVLNFYYKIDKGDKFFHQLETLFNSNDGRIAENGLRYYRQMLSQIGMDSDEFKKIVKGVFENISLNSQMMEEALIQAAKMGEAELLNVLLEEGVDVNTMTKFGRTAFLEAAGNGRKQICEILLEQGANIHIGNELALKESIIYNQVEICDFLLKNGVNPNVYLDVVNVTPLMYAAGLGKIEVCKVLLNHNADVNAKVKNNLDAYTALCHAIIHGNLETCKLLIKHGADVNSKDIGGRSPLIHACVGNIPNQIEICKLLINNGADVNAKDNCGKTALFYSGNAVLREILINAGAV